MLPHFSHQIPVPFNTNSVNIGPHSNNILRGLDTVVKSEAISDRLEITELSDHEGEFDSSHPSAIFVKSSTQNGHSNGDHVPSKHQSTRHNQQLPSHLRRQQANSSGGNQNKKGGNNIFDMPSGLY